MKTYSELCMLDTIDERFDYLSLRGSIGYSTFGYDRWLNQSFYRSREWRDVRNYVIVRDDSNDMGLHDYPVRGFPQIHHINPITAYDIEHATHNLFDPENLICVSHVTHNAIHYGDKSKLLRIPVARSSGDTRLW